SKLPEKQKSLQDLRLWSEEMAKIGRERQKNYLSFAQRMIRENFILNTGEEKLSYLNPEEMSFSSKFFPYINRRNVQAFMDLFALAERHIEQNVQAKMVFFDTAVQSILLFK
ncbi:MAG TPA: DNA polymerase III subunit delta, partial [Bacteroidales bacterium]|nr:DNA polymerase III subunit delta [Bacteroidales bacterium]